MKYILGFVAVVIMFAILQSILTAARRRRLMEKYNDEEVVDRIMKKTIWQGETPEQLVDSLGRPVDVDQKVLKTKVKETWKYNQTGKNRFALRITVENGEVVGWDAK